MSIGKTTGRVQLFDSGECDGEPTSMFDFNYTIDPMPQWNTDKFCFYFENKIIIYYPFNKMFFFNIN